MAAELVREYGLAWAQIKSELDRITGEIKAARDRGETVNRGWLLKQGRLAQLERQAEAQVRVFADFAERRITQEQLDAVMLGQIDAENLVVASMGPSPSPLAGFVPHLPVGAASQIIGYSSAGQPLGLLLAELGPAAGKAARSALIRGVVLGKNPRDTTRLLRSALGGNMARALTIARTETLRAYREAQRLTYQANRGVVTGWTWHSALDRRTCPVCWAMHGSFHPLDEQLGSHPNCFPAGTLVSARNVERGYRRWYDGELVEVVTASGNSIRATPNHPVLTRRGWTAAGLLDEGDHLICDGLAEYLDRPGPDVEDGPVQIEQLFDALANLGHGERVDGRGVQFHGDGRAGDVDVVTLDRRLGRAIQTAIAEPAEQFALAIADEAGHGLAGPGPFSADVVAVLHAAAGVECERCETMALFGSARLGEQEVGLTAAARLDAVFQEPQPDGATSDAEVLCDRVLGLSGEVSADKIVRVERESFHGYVFNLQTAAGFYLANAIVSRNCRCAMIPATKSWGQLGFPTPIRETRFAPELGPDVFARLDKTTQLAVLGPGKLAAYQTDDLTLDDLVKVTRSPRFGTGRAERSLRDVLRRAA